MVSNMDAFIKCMSFLLSNRMTPSSIPWSDSAASSTVKNGRVNLMDHLWQGTKTFALLFQSRFVNLEIKEWYSYSLFDLISWSSCFCMMAWRSRTSLWFLFSARSTRFLMEMQATAMWPPRMSSRAYRACSLLILTPESCNQQQSYNQRSKKKQNTLARLSWELRSVGSYCNLAKGNYSHLINSCFINIIHESVQKIGWWPSVPFLRVSFGFDNGSLDETSHLLWLSFHFPQFLGHEGFEPWQEVHGSPVVHLVEDVVESVDVAAEGGVVVVGAGSGAEVFVENVATSLNNDKKTVVKDEKFLLNKNNCLKCIQQRFGVCPPLPVALDQLQLQK